jgi:mono/diheme cytochrome c family protein
VKIGEIEVRYKQGFFETTNGGKMRRCSGWAGVVLFAVVAQANEAISVDSQRGEELFQSLPCVRCHSINGKGGSRGPDLAKRLKREYSPAGIAARMWNHAPTMWAALTEQGLAIEPLGQQAAADLFGYFYSLRFFDRPADVDRGRRLFDRERCSGCHSIEDSTRNSAKPVSQWSSLGRPLVFAAAIWSHSANAGVFDENHVRRTQLKGQELTDIVMYLRGLPQTAKTPLRMDTEISDGVALLESKGCNGCHKAKYDLARKLRTKMVNDVAASMWNHSKIRQTASLSQDEMRQIMDQLWTQQVLEPAGDVEAGREVFGTRCAACHNGSGIAPTLVDRRGKVSVVSVVSSLWTHGPKMLARLKQNNSEWPTFTTEQMADVITFLNAGGR